MKGITGHRVHDAYASNALTSAAQVRPKPAAPEDAATRAPQDAAEVRISDGARKLASGPSADPARIEDLREKVAQGASAFDPQIVAQRLATQFQG